MFTIEFTKDEIAVIIGCILVAEPTMPDAVAAVALSIVNKIEDAVETVGV